MMYVMNCDYGDDDDCSDGDDDDCSDGDDDKSFIFGMFSVTIASKIFYDCGES